MLEKYLRFGDIRIGRLSEYQLTLAFIPHENKKKIILESQKGIKYLLALLEAKLNRSRGIRIKKIEQNFPYPILVQTVSEVDRFLEKVSVHIYFDEPMVCVDFFSVEVPRKGMVPGKYKLSRKGLSISDILSDVSVDPGLIWVSELSNKRKETKYY